MGDGAVVGERLSPLRELANILGIVEGLYVLTRACDGDTIQQFKKIKVECLQDGLCSTRFRRELRPLVKRNLRPLKDLFNATGGF